MAGEDTQVRLGHVAGAHGIEGALKLRLHNPDSTTLQPGLCVELRREGERRSVTIDRIAPKPGSEFVRVWVREVVDRDAAAALQGCEVWVDRDVLPDLDADEYYLVDLIGHEVVRAQGEAFESLGTIVDVTSNGMQDLFEIRRGATTWLLPAMPPFVVEVGEGRVVVDVHDDFLMEG